MIFVTLFVVLITLWVLSLVRERRRILKFASNFASPPRNIIFGHVFHFTSDPVEIFEVLMNFHKNYGRNLLTMGIFNEFSLAICEPKDLETMLSGTRTTMKSREYAFLIPWLGTGLLISHGKKWVQRRKIITPSYHFKILEQFIDIFNGQTNIFVEKIRPYVNKGDVNIYKFATLCALDIISEASMGTKVNAQDNPDTDYVKAVKQISLIFFRRVFSYTRQWPVLHQFTPLHREEVKAIKVLHKFTIDVIEKRKNYLLEHGLLGNKENDNSDENNDTGIKKKLTLLDMLLSSTIDGKPLSNEDIREEVDTFMFEGHDTTTSGITFTLYHLASYSELQDKVFQEIRQVFGDDPTTPITSSSLQELKYLEMFIKESMRIKPPVPIIGRKLTEETIISGVKVPEGTNISIPIYALHHDEKIFPDPLKFDPERFTLDAQEKRNPYAYIPFSAGPRNCIGQKFAMLEMKSTVSKIIRHYKLLPAKTNTTLKITADMILKSMNGVHISIEPRNYV